MGAQESYWRQRVIVYVIDGYNVVLSDGRYREIAERDIDAARARLVSDVAAYVHGEASAVVVFDGASNPVSDGSRHDVAGVDVIFSPFGHDADSVIEQIVAARVLAGDQVKVVTSDAQTQWVALGHGALRISSASFAEWARDEALDSESHRTRGSSRKSLDERIDPAVRAALARWASGT